MTLTTEQIHAELRRLSAKPDQNRLVRMIELIDQLPRVDVVDSCLKAMANANDCQMDARTWAAPMRAALRRYLELRGLPADPELEEK